MAAARRHMSGVKPTLDLNDVCYVGSADVRRRKALPCPLHAPPLICLFTAIGGAGGQGRIQGAGGAAHD